MPPHQDGHTELDLIAARLTAFEIEGLIGHGSTGSVYKARQRSLDRDVAIRTISREKSGDASFRTSFRERARSMARLTHPSLIRIFDSGELDGLPYVVMEYVPGKSLRHSARGKMIEPRQAVEIVIAACEGLAHAHANGIAHGAIQPADILLTPKCEPKIGNFGGVDHGQSDGPSPDAAAYMAPELAAGSVLASPLTDVFSIGMVLRELLTGVPAGSAEAQRTGIADPKLAEICHRAAHPVPAQRFHDAATFAKALRTWMAPSGPVAAPRSPQFSAQRPRPVTATNLGPRPGRVLLRNCVVIAALLLAIHGTWGIYQEKKRTTAHLQKIEDAKPPVIQVKKARGTNQDRVDQMLAQARP